MHLLYTQREHWPTVLYCDFQGTFEKFDPSRTKMYLHCRFISEYVGSNRARFVPSFRHVWFRKIAGILRSDLDFSMQRRSEV